jgi:hypothetical protein
MEQEVELLLTPAVSLLAALRLLVTATLSIQEPTQSAQVLLKSRENQFTLMVTSQAQQPKMQNQSLKMSLKKRRNKSLP